MNTLLANVAASKPSGFRYEKPTLVRLGQASELILGGSKYSHDCCDCKFGS